MEITLSPGLEQRFREKVERGDYDDSNALVEEAVQRLIEEDQEDIESLRAKLEQADAQIERGEGIEYDAQTTADLADSVHKRGLRRLAGQ